MGEEICSGNRVGFDLTSEILRIEIGAILGIKTNIDILFEVNPALLIRNLISAQLRRCALRRECLVAGAFLMILL